MAQNQLRYYVYEHNWSPRELQAVGLFAEKSLNKLRRLQSVVEQQIELANKKLYGQQKDDAVWRLQRLQLILDAAIRKKVR